MSQKIFGEENAKTTKGESLGYLTLIRYLAPANESGINVCPNSGACAEVCLYTSGRGRFADVKNARIAKTIDAIKNRDSHLARAIKEITNAKKRAKALGLKLAVRVNGTSDLPADTRFLQRAHPDVQFYDYTKIVGALNNTDVHYTLSYDPVSVPWKVCRVALEQGTNVAMVFDLKSFGGALPATYRGFRVIDGDAHDLRFLDPKGVIVGLKAKGDAKRCGRRANSFVVSW